MKIKLQVAALAAVVLAGGGLSLALAQTVPSPTAPRRPSAEAEVAALHREWILVGWEHKESDGPFNFRQKLGKYYDFAATDVMLYDDFDPQHRIVHSAAAYAAIWEPSFLTLRSAHHRVSIAPTVLVSGGLASSTLQFVARLETKQGKVTGIRTLSSLVWRATPAGWKIVREHNSTVVVPPAELATLLQPAP